MANIHFYRYFFKLNGEPRRFDLVSLIDYINSLREERQKTIKYNGRWLSLSAYWNPNKNNEQIRYFWIDKSLDDNPFSGSLGTTNRQAVPGTLFQPASCLIIPSEQVLVIYQPQGSPTSSEIASYFKEYIKSTDENKKIDIDLDPITSNLTFNNLNTSFEIKSICLSVNSQTFNPGENFDVAALDERNKGILYYLRAICNEIKNDNDNKSPKIEFKISRGKRRAKINFWLTKFLQNEISNDNNGIFDAYVVVRRPNKNKDERISLSKNNNLITEFPADERITGATAIFRIMNELYEDEKYPCELKTIDCLASFIKDQVGDEDTEWIEEPEDVLTKDEYYRLKKDK